MFEKICDTFAAPPQHYLLPPGAFLLLCPRPLEPDVSLDFAHLPSEQGFRPTGIQAPSASCIRVSGGGQMYRVCVYVRVFTGLHFVLFIIIYNYNNSNF